MEDAADGVGGLRTLDGWGRVVVLKAIVGVLGEAIAGAVAGALEGGRGGAGGAAGNIFGDVAEREVVAGGCGFEDDVVAILDFQNDRGYYPLGCVISLRKSRTDGIPRTAEVLVEGKIISRPVINLIHLVRED